MAKPNSRTLALLFTFCAAALPQTQPSNDAPGAVSGVITNLVTHEPVLRAHVMLRSLSTQPGPPTQTQTYGALTDAEGKFSITPVPAGTYLVVVDRVGFVSNAQPRPFELKASDKKDDIKIALMPHGGITGRVVDANGDPVEGAAVSAEGFGPGRTTSSTTDERGQFRIGSLTPGLYRVRASLDFLPFPAEIRTDGTSEVHYASTYYPSSLTAKGASKVTVPEGGEASNIQIKLIRAPIVRVSGVVTGFPKGAENINVTVMGASTHDFNPGGRVKPDGTFEIWRLDPGNYTLVARHFASGQQLQTAPVDIEVAGSNIDHLELRVVPPFDLSGTMQFEDEQAKPQAPPARMGPNSANPAMPATRSGAPQRPTQMLARFALTELNGWGTLNNGRQQTVTAGEDGSFAFKQLAPARYRVELMWNGSYVRSMQLGTQQIPDRILDLRNGVPNAQAMPLTIQVSAALSSITGTVRNGDDPASGARVVLSVDPPDGTRPRLANSGSDGSYRLLNVPPGKYKLAVIDPGDNGAMNGEGLDEYEDALPLTISPNDQLTKDLKARVKAK